MELHVPIYVPLLFMIPSLYILFVTLLFQFLPENLGTLGSVVSWQGLWPKAVRSIIRGVKPGEKPESSGVR